MEVTTRKLKTLLIEKGGLTVNVPGGKECGFLHRILWESHGSEPDPVGDLIWLQSPSFRETILYIDDV